ncbi:MAP7 domain-containing protein 2 isoform X3 [Clupea harengus]|uniref:MAP7 domain-containing protein 2 isoform X3 n=1 Tax=Clupea harengus TaxID=7950 RepID=A0A8M1KHR3_CLUHA|nr:MAP7 domain-containing protein 2 isoform X3 [Clupea harengus]
MCVCARSRLICVSTVEGRRWWVELHVAILSSVWLCAPLDKPGRLGKTLGKRERERERERKGREREKGEREKKREGGNEGREREREKYRARETAEGALFQLLVNAQGEGETGEAARHRESEGEGRQGPSGERAREGEKEAVAMEQVAQSPRRRSDSSVKESLFFPVLERNEKERLEALMRRSMERGQPMDQRPKRWTWGGPPGDCQASSPHRSPYRGSPSRAERKKNTSGTTGVMDESKDIATILKTAQMEKQVGCTTPTLIDPTPKRLESPTTPTKSASPKTQKNHGTPKRARASKSRTQSPCSPGLHHPSSMRHRATTPSDGPRRLEGEEKAAAETRGSSTLDRKNTKSENSERKMPKSASRDLGDRNAESPGTPTGKSFAGTTDAEEAARLLAERRRQARVQKEVEEKQRVEDERLRAEEDQRRQVEERERQEQAALWAEEERKKQEEARQQKELEDRRQRERRWKEMQDQWDREREEAVLRAHREAERKQQERELLKLQEEQERLQRKKRIEEIMKRTRKSEDPKKDEVPVEMQSHIYSQEPVQERRDIKQTSVGQLQRPDLAGVKAGEYQRPTTVESPPISLEPLEAKNSGADDLSDGVQSMDVSPVSRDELVSVPDFSPVNEAPQNSMSNAKALEDLLEITGQASYPRLPSGATLGDLNKNLIEGFSSTGADSQLIQSATSDKLGI